MPGILQHGMMSLQAPFWSSHSTSSKGVQDWPKWKGPFKTTYVYIWNYWSFIVERFYWPSSKWSRHVSMFWKKKIVQSCAQRTDDTYQNHAIFSTLLGSIVVKSNNLESSRLVSSHGPGPWFNQSPLNVDSRWSKFYHHSSWPADEPFKIMTFTSFSQTHF